MSHHQDFQKGDHVVLEGLHSSPHLNGRVVVVTRNKPLSNGRYPVVTVKYWSPSERKVVQSVEESSSSSSSSSPVMFSVKPENMTLTRSAITKNCDGCDEGFLEATLKRCSRCKIASYCSRDCQQNDWAQHKQFCESFRHSRKTRDDDSKLPTDPVERAHARVIRAEMCEKKKDFQGVEKEYRAIIDEGGYCLLSHVCLAEALDSQGIHRWEEALDVIENGLKCPVMTMTEAPAVARSYYKRAYFLRTKYLTKRGNTEAATRSAQEFLARYPNDAEGLELLQRCRLLVQERNRLFSQF